MKRTFSSLLALAFLCGPALAAEQNKPPGQLDKFNGIGRIQDFKAAMPEERQGWQALHDKQPEQAIVHFKAAIAAYPNLPNAYMGLGTAAERQNHLGEAEAAYRGAIKCDTNSWKAWKRLGNLLYQQNKFTEAREALANASALHPPGPAQAQIDKMIQAVEAAKRNGHADKVGPLDTGEDSADR